MAKKKRILQEKKRQKIKQRKFKKSDKKEIQLKQLEYEFYNKPIENFDPKTGEIFEDESYTLYEQAVVQGFYDRLLPFNPLYTQILRDWIDYIVEEYGIKATAEMLSKGADAGLIIDKPVIYKSDQQGYYMNQMLNYLPDVQKITRYRVKEISNDLEFGIENDENWL